VSVKRQYTGFNFLILKRVAMLRAHAGKKSSC